MDLVRARLAFAVKPQAVGATKSFAPTGVAATLLHVAKTEGTAGLYRGLVPTIWYIIPKAGLNFYCFEKVKSALLTAYPNHMGTSKNDQIVLTVPAKLIAGGISGTIAQSVAYPLEVCRRFMQLSTINSDKPLPKGTVQTLVHVYKQHGIANGLFRGMTVNYVRTAPLIAINFAVYELMKQQLGIQTGIDIKTD